MHHRPARATSCLFRLVAISLFLATARASEPIAPDVDELIRRNTLALGGAEAMAAINTLQIELRITEGNSTIEGKYATDRSGRMRIDIHAGGKLVWIEALDGQTAWCREGGEAKPVLEGPDASAALKHGLLLPGKIFSLREIATRGVKLSLSGRELIEGVNYFVLQMSFPDGFANFVYLNPDSYLIERQRDFRAMHPDADLTKKRLEIRYSDFRKVAGVVHNFQEQTFNLDTGKLVQTATVTSLKCNAPLGEGVFAMPH